jgi:hypothetical protein
MNLLSDAGPDNLPCVELVAATMAFGRKLVEKHSDRRLRIGRGLKPQKLRMIAIPTRCTTENLLGKQRLSPGCDEPLRIKIAGMQCPQSHSRISCEAADISISRNSEAKDKSPPPPAPIPPPVPARTRPSPRPQQHLPRHSPDRVVDHSHPPLNEGGVRLDGVFALWCARRERPIVAVESRMKDAAVTKLKRGIRV